MCVCILFIISRVLIKSVVIKKYDKEEEMISIISERIMIQPYSMLVNFQRNLCPWNTSLPLFDLDIKMGIFKVCTLLHTFFYYILIPVPLPIHVY